MYNCKYKSGRGITTAKLSLVSAIAFTTAMPNMVNAAELEEIIVTAQKKEQSLMEVPISIIALTGDKISDAGINNLADMSGFVPGVHIGRGPINTTINIRGIGSGIDRGVEQSVGMYIDGIYMGRGRQFRSPFLDVQRVEVLRGPQGILFGKNAIAGAINIISADPIVGGDTEGSVAVRVETEGGVETTGMYSTSVSDTVAVRFAGKYRSTDGFAENVSIGVDTPEAEEVTARLTVAWKPTDNLSVNTKLSYTDFSIKGVNAVPIADTMVPGAGGLAPSAFAALGIVQPDFSSDGSHDVFMDSPASWTSGRTAVTGAAALTLDEERQLTESTNLGITVAYESDGGWRFDSVTGYSEYDTDDVNDTDFTPLRLLLGESVSDFEQASQEFRISYLGGDTVEFIGGLYLEQQEMSLNATNYVDGTYGGAFPLLVGGFYDNLYQSALGFPPSALVPGAGADVPDVIGRDNLFQQDTDTVAVFAEVTWNFAENLSLILGGRYSVEGKDIGKSTSFSAAKTAATTTGLTGTGLGIPLSPIASLEGAYTHVIWNNLLATTAHDFNVSGREDNFFDPSAKVIWDMNDDSMFYLSYSEGHKSGGYNSSPNIKVVTAADGSTSPGEGFSYEAETAKSFELGYKGSLAEGSVQLGVSVFTTTYDDLQVSVFEGTAFIVGNAAAADLAGLEADIRWALSDNIELGASFAYLDFEFSEYGNAGCTIDQNVADPVGCGDPDVFVNDLTGRRNAFAPEYSGNVYANFRRDVFDGLELKTTIDANLKSEMYLDYDLDERTRQSGYAKINLRVALAGETWEVAVFGRNLSDETTHAFAVDTPLFSGAATGFVDQGAIYGAEAKFLF